MQAPDRPSDWMVFQTSQGHVGRGRPLFLDGDHVCVFLGDSVSFVIRKASSVLLGILHGYRLVGEYYVESLIRKEGLDMNRWRSGPIVLESLQAAFSTRHH